MAGCDETLVRGVLRGDASAFGDLYRRWGRVVVAMCKDQTGDVHAAADLSQEVFLRAYRRLRELREPGRFGAWLCGIARHACREWRRDHARRRLVIAPAADGLPADRDRQAGDSLLAARDRRAPDPLPGVCAPVSSRPYVVAGQRVRALSQGPSPESRTPHAGPPVAEPSCDVRLERLRQSLAILPDDERLALHVFYLLEHRIEDVCAVLEISRSAAYRLLARARRRLRELIDQDPDAEIVA